MIRLRQEGERRESCPDAQLNRYNTIRNAASISNVDLLDRIGSTRARRRVLFGRRLLADYWPPFGKVRLRQERR